MHFIDKCIQPVTDNVPTVLGGCRTLNHWYVYHCNNVPTVPTIFNFFLWGCGVYGIYI